MKENPDDFPVMLEKSPEDILDPGPNEYIGFQEYIESEYDTSASLDVAILISKYNDYEGAAQVAKEQKESLSPQHNVEVFSFDGGDGSISIIDNSYLSWLWSSNTIYRGLFPYNLPDNFRIASTLTEFDLVIVHQANLLSAPLLSKVIGGSANIVYYNHHISTSSVLLHQIYEKLTQPFLNSLIKRSDEIISISRASRYDLEKKLGVESSVVYNTVDYSRFTDEDPPIPIEDRRYIFFVGRGTPHKNIDVLIECYNKVYHETDEELSLIIAGEFTSNSYHEEIVDLSRDSPGEVKLLGRVSNAELTSLYRNCTVYASCSCVEGFNLPLLEAQLFGKPVVAFDIGPHEEIVEKGFLVRYNNKEGFEESLMSLI